MLDYNSKLKNISFREIIILATLFILPFYFVKLKYDWISLNLVEILILALLVFWLFSRDTRYEIRDTRYQLPVFLILAGVIFSIVVNKNYYVGFGILKGWFVLPMIFVYVFYDSLKKNERLLGWSLWALFYSGAFLSIEGIYYRLSGLLTYDGRLKIFFDSPNQLAMFLGPVFLIGILRFNLSKLLRLNLREGLSAVSILLVGINLYLTNSFGAWVAVGLAFSAVFWLKYSKKEQRAGLVIFLLILLILFGWIGISKYKNIERLGERSSLASRMMIWKSAGLMLKNNLLFGIGPGNFQNKYLEYQKYFPPYLEWAVPQPHNLFLAWWLEAGFLGLLGFILLLVQFFRDNKKAIRANRETALVCFGIILYFIFHGLVDTTYWRNDMAVVFWIVVMVNLYLSQSKSAAKSN